ncbi:hypothetical protein Q7P35_002308 [Cladosporium inversicolor]
MPTYSEDTLITALTAYRNSEYSSIRKCAYAFNVPASTLSGRLSTRTSYSKSHESQKILSTTEEQTLLKAITRLSESGYLITLSLTRELAEEIRLSCFRLSSTPTSYPPISKRWIDKLRKRYPELKTVYSRSLDASRFEGVTYPIVDAYFDALTDLFLENSYPPDAIFNVDETGFALGTTLPSKVLIRGGDTRAFKKISRKQEWITAIECIRASGVALPPLLIFKAKYTNSAWIPTSTPNNWKFSTSTSGWTSDNHAYEWLTTLFEPETRRNDGKRRLLLLDGHGSHLTARFIAFCLDRNIDLVVLPPHTSHVLQPLDVGVFSPLKRALSTEIEKLFCLDTWRVPRIEWTEAYIIARHKAFTTRNVESSFRAAGIYPLSPITILSTLRMPTPTPWVTPLPITTPNDLDRSLLDSSPPVGTELREATSLVNSIVRSSTLETPVKRYIERSGLALERTTSENTLLRKELTEARELLRVRKERKKGKRVVVKGKFVFNTKEILELVEEAEVEASKGRLKKRRTTRAITPEFGDEEEEGIEESIYESESDCIIVASSRSKSSKKS